MANKNYLETEDRTRGSREYEKIHGKRQKVGKETGKRVAKKATGAMAGRRRRMKEELGY